MNDRYRRIYEAANRTLAFLNAYLTSFTGIAIVAEMKTELAAALETLANLGADKVVKTADSKDKTIQRGDARDTLLDAMRDIAEMWRRIAPKTGGEVNKFRMPRGGDQDILATAESFADQAEPLKTEFTNRGFGPDFIENLQTATETFAETVNESESARRERVGTNAGFDEPIKTCKNLIEDLDPIVKMKFRDNPQVLAEWTIASHIERRAKRNGNGSSTNPPPA